MKKRDTRIGRWRDYLSKLFGRKQVELVEGYHIDLFPDRMSPLDKNELAGIWFRLNGWPVRVIENSALWVTIRYIPFWQWRKLRRPAPSSPQTPEDVPNQDAQP